MRGSTSAKTGTPPSMMKQFAVATNETGDVITSSPGSTPAMWQSMCKPGRAARHRGRVGRADPLGDQLLEAIDRRPEREPARAQDVEDELLVALIDVRARERNAGFGPHASAGVAFPTFAYSSHCAQRSLLPRHVSRYAVWSSFVTGPGGPMSAVVHLADRRHLGGRSGHEDLVGGHEVGADQVLLLDGVAEVLRDLDQRVARDPGQDRGRERRSRDRPVLDDEHVLAGAVCDEPLGGEQNRLVVAGAVGLGHREHRVQVDARRLRRVRDRVRPDALPGRDLHADPVLQALVAEVRAPRPAHDHDVDRVARGRDAELSVARRTRSGAGSTRAGRSRRSAPCTRRGDRRRSTAAPCTAASPSSGAATRWSVSRKTAGPLSVS